ncbi:hypothetical protein HS1genome_1483 [Sulfodiicoccus acidiphilus]|uniref:Uncharacterized protein n=1 Tax=Sulfodiicoccus acidiphilus TaxID=1670455 RepID=A0A348B4J2_9CREN|nr:hypothetical protein [Sulfodiicoccus acidiphilus]BBD73094.1 hypothetical protein HS1genome_1483 [Sulfodiicoccus acidiphilus]GGU00819.1 hypothetical protein GCM10007116_17630 [Sulfodiicoccus acidiphilus]
MWCSRWGFYEARKRFLKGQARFPREKKSHEYYGLVYSQKGWKVLEVRTKNRKK